MTALNNNFNGGPDGTTISTSNSNQFGDNAFDSVSLGGISAFAKFQTADDLATLRPQTQFILGLFIANASSTASVSWSTSMGLQTQFWTRFYIYITNVSANANNLPLFTAKSGSTAKQVSVYIRTASFPHVMAIQDSGSVITLGSVTPAAQAWVRFELGVNTTTDVATLNMYSGADLDSANTTDTITQSTGVYASCDHFSYGFDAVSGAQPEYALSEVQLNTTGYPGPAPWRQGLGAPSGCLTSPIAIHSAVD